MSTRANVSIGCLFCQLLLAVSAYGAAPATSQSIGNGERWAPSRDDLVVLLMGDPQIAMAPETPAHVATAMADILTLEHSFLAVLGDLVQNKAEYYEDYRRLVLDTAKQPVFSVAGNGDVAAGLKAYQRATGLGLYYTVYRRGIRFIFTSTTGMSGRARHICHPSPDQMAWLRAELARDTQSTTVILSHAPVFETTFHSEDRRDKPFPGSMYLYESPELRKLFGRYANIKVFASGHLHHRYGTVDEHGRSQYAVQDNVLHISVGATANGQGSVALYIGRDVIAARVRDHARQRWIDEYQYVVTAKTTLRPAQPVDRNHDGRVDATDLLSFLRVGLRRLSPSVPPPEPGRPARTSVQDDRLAAVNAVQSGLNSIGQQKYEPGRASAHWKSRTAGACGPDAVDAARLRTIRHGRNGQN